MWLVMLVIMVALGGLLVGGLLNRVAMRWDGRLAADPRVGQKSAVMTPVSAQRVWLESVTPIPVERTFSATASRSADRSVRSIGPVPKRIGWFGRDSTSRLPRQYLFGQWAAGVVFAVSAASLGLVTELVPLLFFVSILLVIVQTDLAERIIPDLMVLIGVTGLLMLRLWSHPLPYWNYVVAALAGSGVLLVIGMVGERLLGKETMGGGDVKLYLVIGLMLGIKLTLLSLFVASLIGLVVTVMLRLAGRGAYGELVPFGPYIAVGAWCTYLWGEGWLLSYLEWVQRSFGAG